jgi:enoyl-CoA hydratase
MGDYPDYSTITIEQLAEPAGAVRLTLNRPQALNALSGELLDELFDAVERFDDDRQAYVLIIRGAGRSFCAGYDLASSGRLVEPGSPGDAGHEQSVGRSRRAMLNSVDRYIRLWNLRKPTIAQVHGHCISGGTELVSMCDFIVCSEDARFGHIAGRHMGTLRTLSLWPWTIGYRHAKELFMTGELVDGKTAEQWGLANRAVPPEDLERATLHLAAQIMRIPLEINTLHKHAVNRWMEIQGVQAALHSSAEFDVYTTFIDGRPGFGERVQKDGLREALKWRDTAWQGTELWDYAKRPSTTTPTSAT